MANGSCRKYPGPSRPIPRPTTIHVRPTRPTPPNTRPNPPNPADRPTFNYCNSAMPTLLDPGLSTNIYINPPSQLTVKYSIYRSAANCLGTSSVLAEAVL